MVGLVNVGRVLDRIYGVGNWELVSLEFMPRGARVLVQVNGALHELLIRDGRAFLVRAVANQRAPVTARLGIRLGSLPTVRALIKGLVKWSSRHPDFVVVVATGSVTFIHNGRVVRRYNDNKPGWLRDIVNASHASVRARARYGSKEVEAVVYFVLVKNLVRLYGRSTVIDEALEAVLNTHLKPPMFL